MCLQMTYLFKPRSVTTAKRAHRWEQADPFPQPLTPTHHPSYFQNHSSGLWRKIYKHTQPPADRRRQAVGGKPQTTEILSKQSPPLWLLLLLMGSVRNQNKAQTKSFVATMFCSTFNLATSKLSSLLSPHLHFWVTGKAAPTLIWPNYLKWAFPPPFESKMVTII